MPSLSRFLAAVAALVAIGWIALAVLGDRFRSSFGASPVGVAKALAVPGVALVFVLAALLPSERWLLHASAVAAGALLVASLLTARESLFVATVGAAYSGLWLLHYLRSR